MSDVARILEAYGQAQAEAARQKGMVWGSAVQQLGQIPQQIQQQRRQSALMLLEQARELRARGEYDLAQKKFEEAERTHQHQQAITQAMFADDPTKPNVQAGVKRAIELNADPAYAYELGEKFKPKLTPVTTRDAAGMETTTMQPEAAGLVTETKPPLPPSPGTIGQFLAIKAKEKGGALTAADIAAATKEYKTAEQVEPIITPYQREELGMQGAARTETARHNRAMEAAAPKPDDAESIADAIISGDQPPVTTGLYRLAGPVRASLAKKGYDLTTANLDFQATQKHIATLNGAQQTRLRQAVVTASDSLGVIEDLAKQWDAGKFPLLNRAQLVLAKNGAMGPKAQQIATNLEAQITDVTSELGNVYMGGNSPTDHALQLAGKNLSADWNKDQLLSAIKLARTNLKIRGNSMTSVGAAGLSTAPATEPTAPQMIEAKDPQGNIHHAPAGTTLPAGWTLIKR